jgi:hypothetical protein
MKIRVIVDPQIKDEYIKVAKELLKVDLYKQGLNGKGKYKRYYMNKDDFDYLDPIEICFEMLGDDIPYIMGTHHKNESSEIYCIDHEHYIDAVLSMINVVDIQWEKAGSEEEEDDDEYEV